MFMFLAGRPTLPCVRARIATLIVVLVSVTQAVHAGLRHGSVINASKETNGAVVAPAEPTDRYDAQTRQWEILSGILVGDARLVPEGVGVRLSSAPGEQGAVWGWLPSPNTVSEPLSLVFHQESRRIRVRGASAGRAAEGQAHSVRGPRFMVHFGAMSSPQDVDNEAPARGRAHSGLAVAIDLPMVSEESGLSGPDSSADARSGLGNTRRCSGGVATVSIGAFEPAAGAPWTLENKQVFHALCASKDVSAALLSGADVVVAATLWPRDYAREPAAGSAFACGVRARSSGDAAACVGKALDHRGLGFGLGATLRHGSFHSIIVRSGMLPRATPGARGEAILVLEVFALESAAYEMFVIHLIEDQASRESDVILGSLTRIFGVTAENGQASVAQSINSVRVLTRTRAYNLTLEA